MMARGVISLRNVKKSLTTSSTMELEYICVMSVMQYSYKIVFQV